MSIIDSHIHISQRSFDQTFPYIDWNGEQYSIVDEGSRESLIAEMKKRGIACCIEPAIEVDSNEVLLRMSRESGGFIYPAVGNHPSRCACSSVRDFKRVRTFAENDCVVAIGETGLDYHSSRQEQHRLRQKIWFLFQIDLADRLGLPLILHIRDADRDVIRILRMSRKKLHGGVCHCFRGDPDLAKTYTEEFGLHLGIGGSLLREDDIGGSLCQAVEATPLEYILLETDGPYVRPDKPDNYSGKQWNKARNTSLILPAVAARIASLKSLTADKVLDVTTENTKKLFGLTI